MSWDPHVVRLMAGPNMKFAGLFGPDGVTWGTSAGFEPSADEVKCLINLANGDEYKGQKLMLSGKKYLYRGPGDDGLITVLSLGDGDKLACTVALTPKSVLIGVALAATAGPARLYLDNYKNYLKELGY